MPTRKIADIAPPSADCRDREHRPPTMQVFEPGVYEHTCPACGKKSVFTVMPRVLRSSERERAREHAPLRGVHCRDSLKSCLQGSCVCSCWGCSERRDSLGEDRS